jgi:2-amino-4-hydroxy-6-hydroxymethyldihydropteridine diphosphokinase
VQIGQQVECSLLRIGCCTAQRYTEPAFAALLLAGHRRSGMHAVRQPGFQCFQGEAGPRGDDPLGEHQGVGGAMPVAQGLERIGADQAEELVAGRKRLAQVLERVIGVVVSAVHAGRVDGAGGKRRMAGAGKLHHHHPVFIGRLRLIALQGLTPDRGHEDAIEMQALHRGEGDADVSRVRRVKAAAEEGDAHCVMLIDQPHNEDVSIAAIGVGANLPSAVGAPAETIAAAIERLGGYGRVTARSALYRTAPVGYVDQPAFVNAAVLLETELRPLPLLDALLGIERSLGRDRASGPPKGPRTLDLDLLLYDLLLYGDSVLGGLVLDEPGLTLPHPAMHQRRFVLAPLAEIAPEWRHPVLGRTIAELLAGLPQEDGSVARISE